jgi:ribosomal protein RSM22 (predicted rRNA methylase)
MQLPDRVRRIIDERAEEIGFAPLVRAAEELSAAYREGRKPRLVDEERVAAYLVTRMPATYAAVHKVVSELRGMAIGSVLDVGAGTGAASLAAREWFPEVRITMVERDRAMADAARLLLPGALVQAEIPQSHDLVIASYSVGEMGAGVWRRLWQAARVALVIIEPGTPRGFALVRKIRTELIEAGAHIVAPCPGDMACPMSDPDWCHFAARVERSSLHRRVKHGELGHEDEKFSYVAAAMERVTPADARIIRHPRQQPGLIVLETCTPAGLRIERVSKRDREAFRKARRASWGGTVS